MWLPFARKKTGVSDNAAFNGSASCTHRQLQSKLTNKPLCALVLKEWTRERPCVPIMLRSSGSIAKMPAYAASTCILPVTEATKCIIMAGQITFCHPKVHYCSMKTSQGSCRSLRGGLQTCTGLSSYHALLIF